MLKKYSLLIALSLSSVFSYAASATEFVSNSDLPFLYDSRAAVKTPETDLAYNMSTDYRNASDEFSRHDLFAQLEPVIKNKIKQASKIKQVSIRVSGELGDYDFDKHAFPTGFSSTTFIPFKYQYAVTFTNTNSLKSIPVPMAHARSLSPSLKHSRHATYIVTGDIVGAKEQEINYYTYKTTQVKITKIEAVLNSGKKVGVKLI